MIKNILIITLVSLLFSSCINVTTPEDFLSRMNINLESNYDFIELNSSSEFGTSEAEFQFKLDKADYDNVVNTIKSFKSFKILDSLDNFPNGNNNHAAINTNNQEFSCFRNGTYYKYLYLYESENLTYETFTLLLYEDSTLHCKYLED